MWVRDHDDERSICRRRIAGVEGIRDLPSLRSYVDTPIDVIIKSSTTSKQMGTLDSIVGSTVPWNSH